MDVTVQLLSDSLKTGASLSENISNGNPKRKSRRKKKKATINEEVASIGQIKTDAESTDNLVEGIHGVDHTIMDKEPVENIAEGSVIGKRKKKGNKTKKAKIKDEVQSMDQVKMDIEKIENIVDGTVTVKIKKKRRRTKKAKTKDEIQSVDRTVTDKEPIRIVAEVEKAKNKDEAQSMEQMKMDTVPIESIAEGNVIGKRKKNRRGKKKEKIENEIQSLDQIKLDTGPIESIAEGEKAKIKDEVQSIEHTIVDSGPIEIIGEGNSANIKDEARSMDQMKMDTGLIENIVEENVISKRKKKREGTKNANIKDETESADQNKMETGPTESIAEGEEAKIKDGVRSMDQMKMDTGLIENIVEENVIGKRKKKRKRTKNANIKDEIQSVDQTKMDTEPIEDIAEGKSANIKDVIESIDRIKMDTGPIEKLAEGNVLGKRKRKRRRSKKTETKDTVQSMDQIQSSKEAETGSEVHAASISNSHLSDEPTLQVDRNGKSEYGLSEVSNKLILNEQKDSSEGRSVVSACDVRVGTDFAVEDERCLHLAMAPITSNRRKLLVLDLNGLLADILMPAPKHCRGDIHISGRAIFRRPFCRDFLEFCFQNFDVGVWSSRAKRIVDRVVDYLLGDLQHKLKFCWDMSRCTQTGLKTLDNKHKPLVCKELRKIWELGNPFLRWKKGDYDESNTLLLDDSPYKALLNPLHTAIFPLPYCYKDRNDISLGPTGDLRVYLTGLLKHENVQKYVEQNPFGQRPIDEQHVSWEHYSKVLDSVSK